MTLSLRPAMENQLDSVLRRLIEMQLHVNEMDLTWYLPCSGDTLDIFPISSSTPVYWVEYFGDEIERIPKLTHLTENP